MSGYAPIYPLAGMPAASDLMTPDTVQRFQLGMVCEAIDPYFGYGKFMYLKAAAIQAVGSVVTVDENFTATAVSNALVNVAFPVLVARQNMAANTFGWYMAEGMGPIRALVALGIGAQVGLSGTAGAITTWAAGKQILGMQVLQAGGYSITKANVSTQNGSTIIQVPNVEGLFVGMGVTGTGIPASTTIAAVDTSGRAITVSNASTATGVITMTCLYTSGAYVLGRFNSPHTQGAIT